MQLWLYWYIVRICFLRTVDGWMMGGVTVLLFIYLLYKSVSFYCCRSLDESERVIGARNGWKERYADSFVYIHTSSSVVKFFIIFLQFCLFLLIFNFNFWYLLALTLCLLRLNHTRKVFWQEKWLLENSFLCCGSIFSIPKSSGKCVSVICDKPYQSNNI